MVYQQCGPVCPQTCDIINGGVDCIGGCVEGCFCPSGQVLLDGNCTSVETIKCPGISHLFKLSIVYEKYNVSQKIWHVP